jgi:ferredoxin-NAD(P)+ reductase (naphthalene dioxygenase ferredoxin-specific)
MEVLVQPGNRVLSLKPGENLLQAMRAAELAVSYSCEDGRCGLCRCRLVRGSMVETARPPRQLFGCRTRYVLACQSAPAEASTVEIPDGGETVVHPARRGKVKVLGVESLNHCVRLLRLSNDPRMAFTPGQFAEIEFERGLARVYSMSSLPGDEELRFHVRLHPNGRASQLVDAPLVGSMLRLRGPYGAAWLRMQHAQPILCIAAGTGLAPLVSVLRGIAQARLPNPVHVYAGFMSREEVYGQTLLAEALQSIPNLRCAHTVVATGKLERGLRRGLLTEVLLQDLPNLAQWHAQVYGSPFAIEATVQLLRRLGIAEERLHADPFHLFGN